jgi:TPR repeat protein
MVSSASRDGRWWRQAAESRHPDVAPFAAFQLGVAVQERDRAEAERWWRYAADRGHPGAAFNLTAMVDESAPEIPWWLLTATIFGTGS